MSPWDRLESVRARWLAGGVGEPTWYAAPVDVLTWLVEDANTLSPAAPDVPTFRGCPVIAAPGYGAGSGA